ISHLNEKVPPRLPPRIQRTPNKHLQTVEQEVPTASTEPKANSNIHNRRPPPPLPLPVLPPVYNTESNKSNKMRLSRKLSRSNSIVDV
ncbi:unnamed protein product, partial [Rotaria magnacalcarata]